MSLKNMVQFSIAAGRGEDVRRTFQWRKAQSDAVEKRAVRRAIRTDRATYTTRLYDCALRAEHATFKRRRGRLERHRNIAHLTRSIVEQEQGQDIHSGDLQPVPKQRPMADAETKYLHDNAGRCLSKRKVCSSTKTNEPKKEVTYQYLVKIRRHADARSDQWTGQQEPRLKMGTVKARCPWDADR